MKITKRNQLGDLLTHLGLKGEGAEIGVAEGGYSSHLLGHWQAGKLHLVDCWEHLSEGYQDGCNVPCEDQEIRYQKVLALAKRYGGRAVVHRMFSLDAVKLFKPESLVFCYLDANHSRPAVTADIAAWWPIMKSGGVFAGHDYLDGDHGGSDYGVLTAVTEFAARYNLHVNVIREEWPSWWVVKP